MFSHIIIFWTNPDKPDAADRLVQGANELLREIPGVTQLHAGRMVGSERPVVEQGYQVALNVIFPDKQSHDSYQVHPLHTEYVETCVKPFITKLSVYDFA